MPTFLNIIVSLVSQFDALQIGEYQPPASSPDDPFSSKPTLLSPSQSVVSVYVPTYPNSTFWLAYTILPPHPPKALYYFKLFINGTHIVSWGCGEAEKFTGKTMFGLFHGPQGGLERRVLSFEADTGSQRGLRNDMMELRVYRAKSRRRIPIELEEFEAGANGVSKARDLKGSGMNLINGGCLQQRDPQRYYQYALIDELANPYATFRYYYRTWAELKDLGVTSTPPSPASSTYGSFVPGRPEPIHSLSHNSQGSITTPLDQKDKQKSPEDHTLPHQTPDSTSPLKLGNSGLHSTGDDDSPLRLPRTHSLPAIFLPPPPSPPKDHSLSPVKLQLRTGNSQNLTPTRSSRVGRIPRTTSPTRIPGQTARLEEDLKSSSEGSRKAEFGDLVANLMRHNASPRPRREEIRTVIKSSEEVDEAIHENGSEMGDAKRIRRVASLGFLKGATMRRRGRTDDSM